MENYKTYEWLYTQYCIYNKTCSEIGEMCNVSKTTILTWLYKLHIKKPIEKRKNVNSRYRDKKYLYTEHIINKRSMKELAQECNVSQDTIRYNMQKYKIQYWREKPPIDLSKNVDTIISRYINDKVSANQLAKDYGTFHSTILAILRKNNIPIRSISESELILYNGQIDNRYYDYEWLYDAHWNLGMSVRDISKDLKIGERSIRNQMHNLGIPTRNNSESKIGLMVGPKHPNWKGGLTSLTGLLREYFNTNIAKKILQRDNWECQLCKSKTNLHVHHKIHFSKIVRDILSENSDLHIEIPKDRLKLYKIICKDPRFTNPENLITYCKYCHLFKIHKYKKRG